MKNLDLLCVGHCCHDVAGDGYILGGTSSYAAIVAKRLGLDVAILTSVGPDFLFRSTFEAEHIPVINVAAEATTIFDNRYQEDGSRRQHILARASTITDDDVEDSLLGADMVLLGPIAKEIDFKLLDHYSTSLKAATLQGLIRKWDKVGFVSVDDMDWDLLKKLDIVFISNDDIEGKEHFLEKITSQVNHVIMTRGAEGASVFTDGQELFFPSFPTEAIDATGAGDVFTVAYLTEYHRTNNIKAACIYGHCAASFIVEGVGISNLPSERDMVERVERYAENMRINQ